MLLAFMAGADPVGAQSAAPSGAPIRDLLRDQKSLVTWLATRSQDAAAAAARVRQAQAAYGTSRLRLNPQLNTTFGGVPVGPTNPTGLGWGDTINYGVGVSQQFEIGKRGPRSTAARFRLESEQQSLASTLYGALGDAREAIARVLYGKTRIAALAEEIDNSQQVLALQKVRLDRGDLSGVDYDRLQLDAQVLEADLAVARSEYEDSLAVCAGVLLAPCDPGDADIAAIKDAIAPAGTLLPADWENALKARPDIFALEREQAAFAQDAVLAQNKRVPDPTVSVGYTRDRFVISGNNPRTLAVGVTIPLPTADHGQHDYARAAASQQEVAANQAGLLSRARSSVAALLQREASITAALRTVQSGALNMAEDVLSVTAAAVTQGELSTTDLLLARRARTELTLRVIDLQLQLYLVQNELKQVAGQDADLVQQIRGATWPTP